MKYGLTSQRLNRPYGDADDIVRQMAEPASLRKLRAQAARIDRERAEARKRGLDEIEKENLRRRIMAAGETPCC